LFSELNLTFCGLDEVESGVLFCVLVLLFWLLFEWLLTLVFDGLLLREGLCRDDVFFESELKSEVGGGNLNFFPNSPKFARIFVSLYLRVTAGKYVHVGLRPENATPKLQSKKQQ
jgi:hypothetical protein